MKPIYKNLYQFSAYLPPVNFTIHQYLLASDPALLFATGTMQQALAILPKVKEVLKGRKLKYIFVSHIESDECGGLPLFLQEYPEVQTICSSLAARELPGHGYTGKLLAVSQESRWQDGALDLQFFDYPSEVHLQNGLVCLEKNSGVFYSADLMLRYGNGTGASLQKSWAREVAAIDEERVPSAAAREQLKAALKKAAPHFVAVGHGFCLECEND